MSFVQLETPAPSSSSQANSAFDKESTQPLVSVELPPVNAQPDTIMSTAYPRIERSVPSGNLASLAPLLLDEGGFAAMRARLQAANRFNARFKRQYGTLDALLRLALFGISAYFSSQVQEVWLGGEDVVHGVNLKRIPYDAIVLTIVLKPGVRKSKLYRRIADVAFAQVDADWLLLQFRLVNAGEWLRIRRQANRVGDHTDVGYRLLSQA